MSSVVNDRPFGLTHTVQRTVHMTLMYQMTDAIASNVSQREGNQAQSFIPYL